MPKLITRLYEKVSPMLVGLSSDSFFLPSLDMSVLDLLRFELISSQDSNKQLSNKPTEFISTTDANVTLGNDILRSLTPPPHAVVQQLAKLQQDGKSILHDGHYLPIDVVDAWITLHHVFCIQDQWKKSVGWLKKYQLKSKPLHSKLIGLLRNTRWSDSIHGFRTIDSPLTTITTYLSNDWLDDQHMVQFAELCKTHIPVERTATSRIVGPYFAFYLSNFHKVPDQNFLEEIGSDLASGFLQHIVGMAHVNGNHWIAFVIDSSTSSIHIGDPLARSQEAFVDVASAWVKHHMGTIYEIRKLNCTTQTDHFSCGIIVMNAIDHFLDPSSCPLLGETAHEIGAGRIEKAIAVLTRHLGSVSTSTTNFCI